MPRLLLSFDKFKNSLTAPAACAIAGETLARLRPDWTLESCPLTDGGEGFAAILTQTAGGSWHPATVSGPRNAPSLAGFGLIPAARIPSAALYSLGLNFAPDSTLAIIEMATASGLAQLAAADRDPWLAHSTGTGELLLEAARAGAAGILLGVGGSATNDLGLGALAALGLHPVNAAREPVLPPVPARWGEITGFAGQLPAALPPIRIACDVSNPLLGANGCTAIYGTQKGLARNDIPALDQAAARIARLLCDHLGKPFVLTESPGAGAAGGIAFGLLAAADAKLVPGADLVARWLDLDTRLEHADIVLTGEGRFDQSSLQGKGPGELALRAAAQGKTVHVFAGSIESSLRVPPALHLHPITPPHVPLAEALPQGPRFLAAAVTAVFAP